MLRVPGDVQAVHTALHSACARHLSTQLEKLYPRGHGSGICAGFGQGQVVACQVNKRADRTKPT